MRLEEGKTKIGLFPSAKKAGEMIPVYYGNIIRMDDGSTAKLREEKYNMFLQKFKESDEYKKYDDYKEEQEKIRQQQIKAEQEAKAAKEAEFERHKDELRAAGMERMEKQVSAVVAEMGNLSQRQVQTEQTLEEIRYGLKQVIDATAPDEPDPNEIEDDEDEEEYEKGGGIGILATLALVLILVLSLISAGLSAYQFFAPSEKDVEQPKDKITITLDGQTYEIESETIEIGNGESAIQLYGIKTTNNNGKTEKEIVPIGNIKVEVPKGQEKTEQEEEPDPDKKEENSEGKE